MSGVLITKPVFAGDLGDRLPLHDDQPHYFLTKLRSKIPVSFRQFHYPFPGRTLFGPQSGKWEAHRHQLADRVRSRRGVRGRQRALQCGAAPIPGQLTELAAQGLDLRRSIHQHLPAEPANGYED